MIVTAFSYLSDWRWISWILVIIGHELVVRGLEGMVGAVAQSIGG